MEPEIMLPDESFTTWSTRSVTPELPLMEVIRARNTEVCAVCADKNDATARTAAISLGFMLLTIRLSHGTLGKAD